MTSSIEQEFKSGMRLLAGAVSLISTGGKGVPPKGLTATAVCSLAVEPPRLLACVNKSASAHDAIDENGVFCINVLSESQRELAHLFSDNDAIDRRFSTGEWTQLTTGAPVLEGSLCSFDCKVADGIETASHTIYIGDVVAIANRGALPPLLYFDGDYSTLAGLSAS